MSDGACTYHIERAGAPVGLLEGVVTDPDMGAAINGGMDALSLEIDHYPVELHQFDLIRVDLPDGTVAGRWKQEEQLTTFDDQKHAYTIAPVPLVAELSEAGLTANFTTDQTQLGTPVGGSDPQLWSTTALAQTMHCFAGTVQALGQLHQYAFNRGQPVDALNQHTLFAGAGWWWFCDGNGRTDVRNTSPVTHKLVRGRDFNGGSEKIDTHGLPNIQPVTGGTPAGASKALESVAADLTGGPYSVDVVGRREAQVYSDSGLVTQAACDRVAATLLATLERPTITRHVTVENYAGPWILPGHAVQLSEGNPDPSLDPLAAPVTLLVQHSIRRGATGHYELELTDMPSVIKSSGGGHLTSAAVALGSLIHNPAQLASVMVFSLGYQMVDAATPTLTDFKIPSNVLLVTKALLSFRTGPFRGGLQTSSGGATSGDEGGHSHQVNLPSHTHSTPAHSHKLAQNYGNDPASANWRLFYFADNDVNAGGNPVGAPVHLDSPSTMNHDLWTQASTGAGTAAAGGGGAMASAGGSAHHHTIPPEALVPPSELYSVGDATDCHVYLDGTDRSAALGGPFVSGRYDDLDITPWLTDLTGRVHILQISSSVLGGIGGQVTIYAVLGAS